MIKHILASIAALMVLIPAMAQSINETNVQISDFTVPAYTVSVNKDADLVEDALKERLKDAKLKTTKTQGFMAALNQVCTDLAATPINFYTKIEEQGRRSNKTVVITFCATPVDLSMDQNMLNSNVQRFLSNFVTYIDRYEASEKITSEEKNLKKAQKAQASAAATFADLQKSINKTQEKIDAKQKEIDKYKEKIAELSKDIKSLQGDMQKDNTKKAEAEKKLNEANAAVKAVEATIQQHRAMLQ